ncbi:hypothetical protein MCAV_01910 [[Mycoplasma] cavipharyngis]|uniref:hypothetical protein n=1 Tax=[Mycoplasma] cavipharyngis TaxID=92757 RepID=UPI003704AC0A
MKKLINILSKFFKSIINQQIDYFQIIWPEDKKLLENANMEQIDWSQSFLIKLLIHQDFEPILAKNNDLIFEKDLFISLHNKKHNYLFWFQNALIIFENNQAHIKICSQIQQFIKPKKNHPKKLVKDELDISTIKKQLRKISKNEILGLFPNEILERHHLNSALKLKKFTTTYNIEPYQKIEE